MAHFVKLPVSNILLNTEEILFVGRKDINQFVVFLKNFPTGPILEGTDYDLLTKAVGAELLVEPPKIAS